MGRNREMGHEQRQLKPPAFQAVSTTCGDITAVLTEVSAACKTCHSQIIGEVMHSILPRLPLE